MKTTKILQSLTCLASLAVMTATLFAAPKHHVLVISLDGMGAAYLRKADEYHLKIPTLRRFMKDGVYAEGVTGVVPTLTYPSHTTMMTGVWPTEHGIYANQKFDPTGALHGEAITEADTIKVKTLWKAAHDAGYTTASVGFPVTTDAEGIDWLMPANAAFEGRGEEGGEMKADPNRHYDHPAGLRETLAPDVEAMKASIDLEHRRLAWTVAILRHYKPDVMTTHIGDLDHAEHTTGPFSTESLQTLEELDKTVAMLIDEERKNYPDAVIAIVSDHGFLPVEKTFHLNAYLHQAGLQQPATKDGNPGSWEAAAWVTGGTAAVMLKNPEDHIVEAKVKALLEAAAANPEYGIAKVYHRDELSKLGGFPEAAFMVEMKPGFKVGAGRSGKIMTDTPHTGTHGYMPQRPELEASFLMMGPGIIHGKNLGRIDMRQIAPTLMQVLRIQQRLGVAAPLPVLSKINSK